MARYTQNLRTILFIFIFYASFNRIISENLNIFQHTSFGCSMGTNASINYQNNVNLLFSIFTSQASISNSYSTTSGQSPDKVYGYYLCWGDLTPQLCQKCMINATEFAQEADCKYEEGIFYSDKCMFRYTNHSTYGLLEQHSIWVTGSVGANVSNYKQFNETLWPTLEVLINGTVSSSSDKAFAMREANVGPDEKIYSLAQCTPDLGRYNCSRCLRLALSELHSCCDGYQEGTVSLPNCQMRYDNQSFYD